MNVWTRSKVQIAARSAEALSMASEDAADAKFQMTISAEPGHRKRAGAHL